MVFQNYALYPHMSVYDNMAYGLQASAKMPKAEIDARVRRGREDSRTRTPLLKRTPRQLSGGQRQRVAMGRAIVRKPAVFLFDEPLSNLDAKLRVQMRIEIRKLQRRLATTSIYVTHDQLEAMTLADMLVVMNAGRVEQVGAPLELYERPASAFVGGFLGSPPMNFLNGVVEKPGSRASDRWNGTPLRPRAFRTAHRRGSAGGRAAGTRDVRGGRRWRSVQNRTHRGVGPRQTRAWNTGRCALHRRAAGRRARAIRRDARAGDPRRRAASVRSEDRRATIASPRLQRGGYAPIFALVAARPRRT